MTAAERKIGTVNAPSEAKRKGPLVFFGELISEFKKVVWPPRRELLRLTLMVIVITVILGALLGGIDYGFTHLITFIGGG